MKPPHNPPKHAMRYSAAYPTGAERASSPGTDAPEKLCFGGQVAKEDGEAARKGPRAERAAEFSVNLFWDADSTELDLYRNKRYVVQRVLERGTVDDLRLAFEIYGMSGVISVAKTLRSLEPTALSFVACIANEPRENFRCYIQKQSSKAPWIY